MKRIKSFAAFVCGIVLIIFGAALLLWRGLGIQGALRTLLSVEIIITGVSVLLYSILAISWLIKAALLIFYERNL